MDSLLLTDFKAYEEYFKGLANDNKLLGSEQFLFGDIEIGQNDASRWKGKKLWAWPATRGRMQDGDNYLIAREGTLWIGGCAPSDKFAEKDEFYQECEVIMKQIVSRMIYDRETAKISVEFTSFNWERADWDLGATRFIGCELRFTFHDPEGFEYNEDDWN